MTSLHVICGLAPPQSKILATPMRLRPVVPKSLESLPLLERTATVCAEFVEHLLIALKAFHSSEL